jgi:toxin-antitoxin system PIN domain toxin
LIAVDTNILVYAHRRDSEWHDAAKQSVRALAEGTENWAIAWPSVHEFLAIVTHERIYSPPSPQIKALDQVRAWFESPNLSLLSEGEGYIQLLSGLVEGSKVTGPKIHDARIAALCLLWNVSELWTADRDFSRFPALKTRNPLPTAK